MEETDNVAAEESPVQDASAGESRDGAADEKVEISYPMKVVYCGHCGLPPEYCEYFPDYDKCRQWLEANLPSELGKLSVEGGTEEEKKGRQKRGGKGLVHTKKPTGKAGPKKINVSRAPRGKRKSVTVVTGLGTWGVDLKLAAKFFSTRFAASSSVTGDDEIVIQGDVKDDLFDVIPEKWPEVDEDSINDLGDQKR